jgi:ComF family protein
MVNVLPQLTEFKGAALDFLFPRFCVGCGKEGDFICKSCRTTISQIEPPVCPRCGKPQTKESLCSNCANWEADIDGIRSAFRFEGVIRKAIHEFKYKNLRALTADLAQFLSKYLVENPIPCEILVPVPLHHRRLRERGYNQSTLLAKGLSKFTGLPVDEHTLIRNRYNLPQAKTGNVEERKQNVLGVFTCLGEELRKKKVLLIDDVTTSGATLNACALTLKTAGAMSVWGLTLAREI